MSRPGLIAALAVIAAGVVAPAAFPASITNPCKLVTTIDAKASLGTAVGKPTLRTLGLYQSCSYSTKTGKVLVVQTRNLSESDFTKSAKANPGPIAAVHGIGSSAYSAGGGATLLVWKNGTEATFTILGAGAAIHTEEQLAKKVVSGV